MEKQALETKPYLLPVFFFNLKKPEMRAIEVPEAGEAGEGMGRHSIPFLMNYNKITVNRL